MKKLANWLRGKITPTVPSVRHQQRLHAHEEDCCWSCDEGTPSHPTTADDSACARRVDRELGRCVYGHATPPDSDG